ncbi:MAG: hypothetical protein HC915_17160 [Anaerolineae bacterium]|nr:hypothetical protein [Anaerolineae bacterium]
MTLWDASGPPLSVVGQGSQNYLPGRVIEAGEAWPRLRAWWSWGQYLLPWGVLLLLSPRRRRRAPEGKGARRLPPLFAAYVGLYAVLHWLLPLHVYDRYLLPLLPALALWLAWHPPTRATPLCAALAIALSLPLAWAAGQGHTPLASDGGRFTGIDVLAEHLNTAYAGEVVYDHDLGWSLGYYLGARPRIVLVWLADPAALVDYAHGEFAQTPGAVRYFVTFQAEAAPWLAAFQAGGLHVQQTYGDGQFAIYALSEQGG